MVRGGATKEIDGAHCCDAIRADEGIHSSSEQCESMLAPASISTVRERDKKECKSRKECGGHDHLAQLGCSKDKTVSQSRTLGTFLQTFERLTGMCLRKEASERYEERGFPSRGRPAVGNEV